MDDAHRLRELTDMRPYVEVLDTIYICLTHRHHTAKIAESTESTEHLHHLRYVESRIEEYHSSKVIRTLVGKQCRHQSSLTASKQTDIRRIDIIK